MATAKKIVGLGEALFDLFGDEARLGGAPLNVAVHAQQLGNHGLVVSRIGQDDYGDRLLDDLRGRDMNVDYIQHDPDLPTGQVIVRMSDSGEPDYDIVSNVAWDVLQYDYDLEDLARVADAICFGTLAQRNGQSRNTIYRFLETARHTIRLLDVNLRQEYYDRRILTRSLELATAAKLNTAELRVLDEMFSLGASFDDAAFALRKKFDLQWVAVTRGHEGTSVYTADEQHTADPVVVDCSQGDAVGAGDATSAALLHGATHRWPWQQTLTLANRLGAFVASQRGACPPLPDDLTRLAAV
ncbi:carbohydrate kinase [Planctomycetales bacterium ZRK34]|nr:carbohydrate kinase [Planctomycetales bacterium ZRK34]